MVAIRRGNIAIAKARLGEVARATPLLRGQFTILAMPFAARAQAALQQGQAHAQAVAFNYAVAIR